MTEETFIVHQTNWKVVAFLEEPVCCWIRVYYFLLMHGIMKSWKPWKSLKKMRVVRGDEKKTLSFALTETIPLASMSKVTSIWGSPLGAGGIPCRSNCPNILLSAAISLSPCNTLMPTWVWLSAAVLKTCAFLVGIVVFLQSNQF